MSILLLLLACKPGSSFDLEGIWRLEVQASTTASGACDVRLLDNVVGAIEDTGGTDTGTDGWTETTEQTTSPATSLVRFARDGDGYVLITGGELLPQEAGGDASSPSFAWTRTDAADSLTAPLRPVVRSAAELLTSPETLLRVRECDGTDCTWLFLDQSRNRSRRWCSMESCGNRAKVRRHYRRRHAGR